MDNKGKFVNGSIPWNKGKHVRLNPHGEFKKGQSPWNKGKKGEYNLNHKDIEERRERARKLGLSQKGKKRTEEFKIKQRDAHLKYKNDREYKSQRHKRKLLRESLYYRNWRSAVFERDNWTCQTCQKRGCRLEAHHKKTIREFPELIFDIENGVTLCQDCHNLTKVGRLKGQNS